MTEFLDKFTKALQKDLETYATRKGTIQLHQL